MIETEKAVLFNEIERLSDEELSDEAIKKTVADIVAVLRERRLTYDQAYGILRAVKSTLAVMSNSTVL